ncbi:alpha/beta fold hydrolase [Microvirga roseola]|uniref:alpha/beta fold hydrolase n=1 Tax=Microvirga roseola TaxID=2883126 RepID=UPI001E4B14E9|nr:alpha/beta hydrolase [Microvirga roseola]
MQRRRLARTQKTWPFLLGGLALAGAAVAISRAQTRSAAPRVTGPAAPERIRSATVDGIRMRWEQHGDDPATALPVVFVHGLPTNPRAWRYVLPRVSNSGVCCLAWELVGFGGSLREGFGRDLSIPAQASYLRAWLRHLGIEKAVFVAHDYGGGVVQHLATTSPDLFLGLVLTDSVAFDNWPVPAVKAARAMRSAIGHCPPRLLEPVFKGALVNLGHTDQAVAAESRELFWRPYSGENGPSAFAHQLGFFSNQDTVRIGHDLHPLGCPTLVVWGEKDPLGLDSAEELAGRLDADLRVIEGAYHFTIEDHPNEIADAVQSVLSRVRSEESAGDRAGLLHS